MGEKECYIEIIMLRKMLYIVQHIIVWYLEGTQTIEPERMVELL